MVLSLETEKLTSILHDLHKQISARSGTRTITLVILLSNHYILTKD